MELDALATSGEAEAQVADDVGDGRELCAERRELACEDGRCVCSSDDNCAGDKLCNAATDQCEPVCESGDDCPDEECVEVEGSSVCGCDQD